MGCTAYWTQQIWLPEEETDILWSRLQMSSCSLEQKVQGFDTCGECPLHGFRQMIEVTMEEVKNLVMFHQVDGKVLCDQGLEIRETDL